MISFQRPVMALRGTGALPGRIGQMVERLAPQIMQRGGRPARASSPGVRGVRIKLGDLHVRLFFAGVFLLHIFRKQPGKNAPFSKIPIRSRAPYAPAYTHARPRTPTPPREERIETSKLNCSTERVVPSWADGRKSLVFAGSRRQRCRTLQGHKRGRSETLARL